MSIEDDVYQLSKRSVAKLLDSDYGLSENPYVKKQEGYTSIVVPYRSPHKQYDLSFLTPDTPDHYSDVYLTVAFTRPEMPPTLNSDSFDIARVRYDRNGRLIEAALGTDFGDDARSLSDVIISRRVPHTSEMEWKYEHSVVKKSEHKYANWNIRRSSEIEMRIEPKEGETRKVLKVSKKIHDQLFDAISYVALFPHNGSVSDIFLLQKDISLSVFPRKFQPDIEVWENHPHETALVTYWKEDELEVPIPPVRPLIVFEDRQVSPPKEG